MGWQNRIVGTKNMAPSELEQNPANWRRHTKAQRAALSGIIGEVGVVQHVVYNQRTKRLIDGHLRVEMAVHDGEESIPVTIVDLDEAEERLVLATLDPIGAMADADRGLFLELRDTISVENEALAKLLDSIGAEPKLAPPGVSGGKSEDTRTFIFTISTEQGELVDKAFAKVRDELKSKDDGEVFATICARV
jgi:hypothetical protein